MPLKRRRAALLPMVALMASLLSAAFLAGCLPEVSPKETPSAGHHPDTTRPSTTLKSTTPATNSHESITTRWPAGVETVILSSESGLCVADSQGVRWEQRSKAADRPSTTVTVWGPPIVSGLNGLAVSGNGELVAYVEDGSEIVVRSVADGNVVQRATVPTEGHTVLRAISLDGLLAALVTVDPQVEAEKPGDEVPWALTVVDLSTGTATAADAVTAFVRQRMDGGGRCGLVGLSWLPEHKLIIGVSGEPYETYLYDPVADRLAPVPSVAYVWSTSPGGLVLGASAEESGGAVVWNGRDGSLGPVIPDAEWPIVRHGSLNAAGTALVLMVAKSDKWTEFGWQVFHRVGSEWRPKGSVAEVDWMHQPPTLLSNDGTKAWTVVPQSTGDNETVLLSHDFTTGAWEEWFGSEDMQGAWRASDIVRVVLED